MSKSFENLIVEMRGEVLWVQIDRPHARNALSRAALAELEDVFTRYAQAPSMKLAVLTGAGNEAFAAGGDLKEFSKIRTEQGAGELFRSASAALDRVRFFAVPVVAAINGWALGGGAELALACDYRIAAAHARLGFVQARLNVTTGFGGGTDLMDVLGPARALRHALAAQTLDAQEALRLGLVDALASPNERLEVAVAAFIEPMLRHPPQVIRGFKALASAARRGLSLEERRAIEQDWFSRTWAHEDHWAAMGSSAGMRGAQPR